MFSHLVWDPDRVFFEVPYLHHPVMWYGVLFAFGFVVGYFLVRKILASFFMLHASLSKEEAEKESLRLVDSGILYIIVGAIVGARLGHVFFYGWPYYREHPLDVFKIWEGGLASHGGAVGILLALALFIWVNRKKTPSFTFLMALDLLVIPTAFAAGCIRIGNFINQEITGIPTSLPWGVIFVNPMDGIPGVPLHPVQLYEAFFYFLVFIFLLTMWLKDRQTLGRGILTGWFLVLVFGIRFVLEYVKVTHETSFDLHGWVKMGQLLSIPFILLGIGFLIYGYARKKR
jgi:phosphatidylglycerol:prolipoprotein diacylglycerol transferase